MPIFYVSFPKASSPGIINAYVPYFIQSIFAIDYFGYFE